jgi:hypothetical protein
MEIKYLSNESCCDEVRGLRLVPEWEIAGWRCAYPAYKTAAIRQKDVRKPVGRIRRYAAIRQKEARKPLGRIRRYAAIR